MDQMGLTCLATMAIIMLVSYLQNRGAEDPKGIRFKKDTFRTNPMFNIGAFAIMIVLTVIYALFW